MTGPDPNKIYPNENIRQLVYIKNVVTRPNIIVGDYTYYDDDEGAERFEEHVTHHYEFFGRQAHHRQILRHRMGSVSTYPFNIMGGGWEKFAPELGELPFKGDTVVGNDVWIGQNAVILPGVHIGDGAIIGANSVVGSNVEPYSVVAGNPARLLRRRFDDETIGLLSRLKWWDKDIDEINRLIPILTCCDIEKVKAELKKMIQT